MKSETGLVLTVVALSLIIGGEFFKIFSITSNQISIAAKEKEALTTIDQLEAIKQGIPYMLNYSFYQAAYVVGKNGGYENFKELLKKYSWVPYEKDLPYWRTYDVTYYPGYYFAQDIPNLMEKIIKEYHSTISVLPTYTIDISLWHSDDTLYEAKLYAKSSQMLTYKTNYFKINDNPNVTMDLDLKFFKMFKLAKEMFTDGDDVARAINKAAAGMPANCREHYVGSICEQYIDPESWLRENCPKANKKFNQSLIDNVNKLSGDYYDGMIHLQVFINKTAVKHVSTWDGTDEGEDASCGCSHWEWTNVKQTNPPEQPTTGCIDTDGLDYTTRGYCANATGIWQDTSSDGNLKEYYCSDSNCTFTIVDCNSWCIEQGYRKGRYENGGCSCASCTNYHHRYENVKYEYKYKGAAKVLVRFNTKKTYPVWDGSKLAYRHFILHFYVLSSNDYNWQPIEVSE